MWKPFGRAHPHTITYWDLRDYDDMFYRGNPCPSGQGINTVDDLRRKEEHGDGSTIGILLAADRDEVAVQYALRGLATPLAISTYTTQRFVTR